MNMLVAGRIEMAPRILQNLINGTSCPKGEGREYRVRDGGGGLGRRVSGAGGLSFPSLPPPTQR
jgi:hypothetical protein